MQRRRCLLPVQLGSGRELEQGTRVGALGRDSEQCSPPCDPGGLRSRSEVCRHGGGPLTGEQAQQRRSLCAKAAADLDADDDEAAATRPRELRVGVASLASGGIVNGPAGLRVGARVWVAGAGDRRDYGGVEGELGPMPQWEAVGDDLDAPPVRDRDLDIHVSDPDIAGDTGSGLTAHPRDGPFEWQRSRREHPRCSARAAVVSQNVQASVAAAHTRGQRERESQASEQDHPKLRTGNDDAVVGGRDLEGSCGVRPGLREQQSARRRCQVSKMRLARALITGPGGTTLPSPQMIARLIPVATGRGDRVGVGEGCPRGGAVALSKKVLTCLSCSCSARQGDVTLQGMQQAAGYSGGPCVDDWQGVAPGGPVRRVSVGLSAPQAEAAKPQRQLRRGQSKSAERHRAMAASWSAAKAWVRCGGRTRRR